MKKMIIFLPLLMIAQQAHSASFTDQEVRSAEKFFRSFDNVTYIAPSDKVDIHVELVSINDSKLEATYVLTAVASEETDLRANGKCELGTDDPKLMYANGNTILVSCLRSGLCFLPDNEVRKDPDVVLVLDGRIVVTYRDNVKYKLSRSYSSKYHLCKAE
jgi:hypothetical protein